MTEDLDIKLIKYTQEGLPLTKTPYKDIADGVGMTEEEVIDRLKALNDRVEGSPGEGGCVRKNHGGL